MSISFYDIWLSTREKPIFLHLVPRGGKGDSELKPKLAKI